jgi:hypothetical protein
MVEIGEADWKVLKQVKAAALERACAEILKEVAEASKAADNKSHQRYLEVWNLVQRSNDKLAAAFDDYRRSTAFIRLMTLRRGGLMTDDEFSRFSARTRELVEKVLPREKR